MTSPTSHVDANGEPLELRPRNNLKKVQRLNRRTSFLIADQTKESLSKVGDDFKEILSEATDV